MIFSTFQNCGSMSQKYVFDGLNLEKKQQNPSSFTKK